MYVSMHFPIQCCVMRGYWVNMYSMCTLSVRITTSETNPIEDLASGYMLVKSHYMTAQPNRNILVFISYTVQLCPSDMNIIVWKTYC